MRLYLLFIFLVISTLQTFGQQKLISRVGPALPVGRELREVFHVGSIYCVGYKIDKQDFLVIPNVELNHFLNVPQKNYEHLMLFSLNCDVNKEFMKNLRGQASLGYTAGINALSIDLVNFDSDRRAMLGHSRGSSLKGSFIYSLAKVSFELGLKYYNPKFRLADDLEQEIVRSQSQTIYGNNLTLYDQRFNLSYLYFLISRKI